ncbi:MAG: translocation/assembly module TamB domain-containing protein, partial [Verrucomicrobia bacterium]|nr:translocation/assembly module TamB domain-containing protein [Verrucomicrobiota bacterium]
GQGDQFSGSLSVNFVVSSSSKDVLPTAQIDGSGNQIDFRGLPIQKFDLAASIVNQKATISDLHISFDPSNYIEIAGDAGLTNPYPYQSSGTVVLQDLRLFDNLLKDLGQSADLAGSLNLNWSGAGDIKNPVPSGEVNLQGNTLKFRALTVREAAASAKVSDGVLMVPNFRLVFDSNNSVAGLGQIDLKRRYSYNGQVKVDITDLSFLNGLLSTFGQDLDLGGKLNAAWNGTGTGESQTGTFDLRAEHVRTKPVKDINADVSADYHGVELEVSRFTLSSPIANLNMVIHFSPEWLEIPTLNIVKNNNSIAGSAKIPLNLHPGSKVPIDLDRPLALNIQGNGINLAAFQGEKPQLTGQAGLQIVASKNLSDPNVDVAFTFRDVRATAVPALSGINSDLSVRLSNKLLTLNGRVNQRDIQPLQIDGKLPLDTKQVITTAKLPKETPIELALKWPRTDLSFLKRVLPGFRIVEGNVNADASATGTIQRPRLAGAINVNIRRLTATAAAVPPISDFTANISFQESRIQIDRVNGLAGGGTFNAGGTINLTNGTNPIFDLHANGQKLLLTRSDDVIVRSNLNIGITGPLSAAEVSGTVGIVNSRFFQEIDLLPLNLPGRPAPKPPAAPPKVSIDTPPLKDWKFNIGVRTEEPFLVQSNLARGRVTVQLQIGGTGANPSVTGFVRVDHLVAS